MRGPSTEHRRRGGRRQRGGHGPLSHRRRGDASLRHQVPGRHGGGQPGGLPDRGLLVGLLERSLGLSHTAQLAVFTGFLGGLTTLSAFSVETFSFIRDGSWGIALAAHHPERRAGHSDGGGGRGDVPAGLGEDAAAPWRAADAAAIILALLRAISSVGERCIHTAEVTGSNPVSPTFRE